MTTVAANLKLRRVSSIMNNIPRVEGKSQICLEAKLFYGRGSKILIVTLAYRFGYIMVKVVYGPLRILFRPHSKTLNCLLQLPSTCKRRHTFSFSYFSVAFLQVFKSHATLIHLINYASKTYLRVHARANYATLKNHAKLSVTY